MKKKLYLLGIVLSLFLIPPLFAAGTGIGETYTTYKERTTAPATPGATYDRLYFTSTGMYFVNSAGTATQLSPIASPTFTGIVTAPAFKSTTGAAAGNMLVSDADGDLGYLSAGATTTILVGGGAANPVWTTATGSGSPVRATSPTITTPTINNPIQLATYADTGSELVTGGSTWTGATGATPPTGWTVVNAGLFAIVDSGDGVPYDIALRITVDTTPTASPAITIPITTISGHGYTLSYAFKKGTAATGAVKLGTTSGGTEYYSSGNLSDAAWATRSVNFIATGTTAYVTLMNNSATDGETALFDTVSLKENALTVNGPINVGGVMYYALAASLSDEGTITLPRVSANWTGRGTVRFSSAATVTHSGEFETGSDGNPYAIRGDVSTVYGAACADTKVCVGTAANENPIILKFRNGAGNAMVEFWYH